MELTTAVPARFRHLRQIVINAMQPPTERAGKPARAVVILGAPCSSSAHADAGGSRETISRATAPARRAFPKRLTHWCARDSKMITSRQPPVSGRSGVFMAVSLHFHDACQQKSRS